MIRHSSVMKGEYLVLSVAGCFRSSPIASNTSVLWTFTHFARIVLPSPKTFFHTLSEYLLLVFSSVYASTMIGVLNSPLDSHIYPSGFTSCTSSPANLSSSTKPLIMFFWRSPRRTHYPYRPQNAYHDYRTKAQRERTGTTVIPALFL